MAEWSECVEAKEFDYENKLLIELVLLLFSGVEFSPKSEAGSRELIW